MSILKNIFGWQNNQNAEDHPDVHDLRQIRSLIAALSDRDVSDEAQKTLVKIGEPAVIPLIEALQSDNENVLWWAARTLGSIGDSRAVAPLIKLYEDPPSARIRMAAGLSLGKLGDPHAIPELVELLQITNFITEVKSMLLAFGPAAVDQIIAFIQQKDETGSLAGVANAIEMLGNIGDPRAEEILRDHTSSEKYPENINNLAAQALAKLGLKIEISQDEIGKIKIGLLSNDYDIRKNTLDRARSAASSIDDPEFHRALQASEKVRFAYDMQVQTAVNTKPIQACLDAIELEPHFSAAYICLSYLYRQYTNEKHKAVEWIEKAIEIDPGNMQAWTEMGMVYVALGDVPGAAHAFHHLISVAPSQRNLEPHCRMTAVYRKLNMPNDLAKVLAYQSSQGVGLDPAAEREWEQMVMATDKALLKQAIDGNI